MSDEIIVSTKEKPGDYDAIETAKPGEPIFTLQGGDPFAPNTIDRWVRLARRAALKMPEDSADRIKLLRKATVAEQVAWKFRDYREGNHQEEAQKEVDVKSDPFADDSHVQLVRASQRLNNAVGEGVLIIEYLEGLSRDDRLPEDEQARFADEANVLREGVEILRQSAISLEPRRQFQDRKS